MLSRLFKRDINNDFVCIVVNLSYSASFSPSIVICAKRNLCLLFVCF